ncbi:Ig-like domain-containing protein [Silvibacterium acidisoli]|uniref:Ig-like domain-containing protein n=1 Tax=Acidobacteriaceae bacterium ZG23-2 TaxID=2883246 RepID=UPI00406CEBDD
MVAPLFNKIFLAISFVILTTTQAMSASRTATTTTLTLKSGANGIVSGASIATGSEVTLTATVNGGSATVTTGQVSFCNAATTHCNGIDLLQISSSGTAVIRLHPGPGDRSFVAVFAGTPNGAPS